MPKGIYKKTEKYKKEISDRMKGKGKGENNPFFGKKHTEETKRKLSEAIINLWKNREHPMLGKKHTEESKRKMSITKQGKICSEETKRKMSEIMKKVWKNIEHPMLGRKLSIETKRKLSEAHKGKIFSEETRRKLSIANQGKILSEEHKSKISKSNKGFRHTEEHKRKIGIANQGKRLGRKHSEEVKIKIKEARKKQIFPTKDTSIEIKIQNFLKELNIEFFTHQYMKEIEHGYQCDILIPSMNLVVECDGDYWHKYPVGNDMDHIRTQELIDKGFKVLRLWEHEIKVMSVNDFKNKLERDKR